MLASLSALSATLIGSAERSDALKSGVRVVSEDIDRVVELVRRHQRAAGRGQCFPRGDSRRMPRDEAGSAIPRRHRFADQAQRVGEERDHVVAREVSERHAPKMSEAASSGRIAAMAPASHGSGSRFTPAKSSDARTALAESFGLSKGSASIAARIRTESGIPPICAWRGSCMTWRPFAKALQRPLPVTLPPYRRRGHAGGRTSY
jgi:hypothetical protein